MALCASELMPWDGGGRGLWITVLQKKQIFLGFCGRAVLCRSPVAAVWSRSYVNFSDVALY